MSAVSCGAPVPAGMVNGQVPGWFSALTRWERDHLLEAPPALPRSPVGGSVCCMRCHFVHLLSFGAVTLPGTPGAVFVLFTVSAFMELEDHVWGHGDEYAMVPAFVKRRAW